MAKITCVNCEGKYSLESAIEKFMNTLDMEDEGDYCLYERLTQFKESQRKTKRLYKVGATVPKYMSIEVEAESEEQAMKLAESITEGWKFVENGHWEIDTVEKI